MECALNLLPTYECAVAVVTGLFLSTSFGVFPPGDVTERAFRCRCSALLHADCCSKHLCSEMHNNPLCVLHYRYMYMNDM